MPAPKQETIDELASISPTIAQLREKYQGDWEAEMAKPVTTPPQTHRPRSWSGGFKPNRKSGNRTAKPSRAQTHLAMALQFTKKDE